MSQVLRHPEQKAGALTELSDAQTIRSDQGEAADRSHWTPFAIAAGLAVGGVVLALVLDATVTRWLTIAALVAAVAAGVAGQFLRRHNTRLDEENREAASEILRRT